MVDPFLQPLAPDLPGATQGVQDARVLRERQLDHTTALDRAFASRPFGSGRQLVQIYNGGAIGSAGGLYYLAHPVLATGTETEGGAGTFTVDTGTTLVVAAVRGVPAAGDYLAAYAVGGRWGVEKAGCATTINVKCSGTAVGGATVTVLSGVSTIASGTTDSSGNVTLNISAAGTYTVTVTKMGFTIFSSSVSLTCGGMLNITTFCTAGITCSPCSIPLTKFTVSWTNVLFGNGSATLVWNGISTPAGAEWISDCVGSGNIIKLTFTCNGGNLSLSAQFWTSGSCAFGGTSDTCATGRPSPNGLPLVSTTCSPFSADFSCPGTGPNACSVLQAGGYTGFTVTP
jgi:hypothetical protein